MRLWGIIILSLFFVSCGSENLEPEKGAGFKKAAARKNMSRLIRASFGWMDQEPKPMGSEADCIKAAETEGFSSEEIARVCQGASFKTDQCIFAARSFHYTITETIQVCGDLDLGEGDCVISNIKQGKASQEVLKICEDPFWQSGLAHR